MNFFRKALHLCTGFANYHEILDLPRAAALRYLAAVVGLLSLVLVAAYVPRAIVVAQEQARWFDAKIPPFAIKDGRLETAAAQPWRAHQDNFVFILDTTGAVTGPETNEPAGLLLTRDSLVFWLQPAGAAMQSQRQALKGLLPDGTINGDYVRRYLHSSITVGAPMALVILFVIGMLATLAHAWFFSFIASILERSHPNPLSPPQLRNIALHAVTPAALVCTVYAAFGLSGVDYWFLYLVVYGIFLVGAANSCRRLLFGEEAQEDESA